MELIYVPPANNGKIMKYKNDTFVTVRISSADRIIYDKNYHVCHDLRSKIFKIIGYDKEKKMYAVLVEDISVGSWLIGDKEIISCNIPKQYLNQHAFCIEEKAIGEVSKYACLCFNCSSLEEELKRRISFEQKIKNYLPNQLTFTPQT